VWLALSPNSEGAEASLLDALAAALEANRRLVETAGELREENARLREEIARLGEQDVERDAERDRLRADLVVLQRMLFGRSSERSGAESAAGDDEAGGRERPEDSGGSGTDKRGPGARAGRRGQAFFVHHCVSCGDASQAPRVLAALHIWWEQNREAAHRRGLSRQPPSCLYRAAPKSVHAARWFGAGQRDQLSGE
jgi:hypothetical protein